MMILNAGDTITPAPQQPRMILYRYGLALNEHIVYLQVALIATPVLTERLAVVINGFRIRKDIICSPHSRTPLKRCQMNKSHITTTDEKTTEAKKAVRAMLGRSVAFLSSLLPLETFSSVAIESCMRLSIRVFCSLNCVTSCV